MQWAAIPESTVNQLQSCLEQDSAMGVNHYITVSSTLDIYFIVL